MGAKFASYKAEFGKTYTTYEEAYRRAIFE